MAQLTIPPRLDSLLKENHTLSGWLLPFLNQAATILAKNDATFFPDYTDHGLEHIQDLLEREEKLVPDAVWEEGILTSADAAVIIGSAVLHDFAMHLYPEGFKELVKADTRFKPLRWFDEDQEGHRRDRPWPELWEEYQLEVRRMDEGSLAAIVGSAGVQRWGQRGFAGDPDFSTDETKRLVGEFIRRHHPRLAHEMAHYGFPGLAEEKFPALAKPGSPPLLGDLVGLVARSHGMGDLRVCGEYLRAMPAYGKGVRQAGCAAFYPMALLRVGDYLQMERPRAPSVLLTLKSPPSLVSVQEWRNHIAVTGLEDSAEDDLCLDVTVSLDLPHATFLNLQKLLRGIQAEMDHSTAVLSEVYGRLTGQKLDKLVLKHRRITSNLLTPSFQKALPYVPEATGYSVDPQLLGQLVEPLYGSFPCVGVRELIQNSVDAVREREEWCRAHGRSADQLGLHPLPDEAEVLVEFVHHPQNNSWTLEVTDRGMGMTASTLQHYFLRAGASFRRSAEWGKEFTDSEGKSKVLRSGRFGIGVFAIFLLGDTFTLETRHVGAGEGEKGYRLQAGRDSKQIVIERAPSKLPTGTRIVVNLSESAVEYLGLNLVVCGDNLENALYKVFSITNWYLADQPKMLRKVRCAGGLLVTSVSNGVPLSVLQGVERYESIEVKIETYKSLSWSFEGKSFIICNGFAVREPEFWTCDFNRIAWKNSVILLNLPFLEVADADGAFPLTAQRYDLRVKHLPCTDALERDVLLNFVAHNLIFGPVSREESLTAWRMASRLFPLSKKTWMVKSWLWHPWGTTFEESLDHYCSTHEGFVPNDTWILSLLNNRMHIITVLYWNERQTYDWVACSAAKANEDLYVVKHPMLEWRVWRRDDFWKANRFSTSTDGWLFGLCAKVFGAKPVACAVGVFAGNDIGAAPGIETEAIYDALPNKRNPWTQKGNAWILNSNPGALPREISSILSRYAEEMRANLGDLVTFAVAAVLLPERDVQPTTPLAKIWNEVLGPEIIPFDPVKRQALIEKARQHPEMKRHLEYWERRKRNEERDRALAEREES